MNHECIYLKQTEPNVHFTAREHIFPAGLGGLKKLDLGMVSDEFNNSISSLELGFMRESPIALSRAISGPGKYGKSKKTTESKVSIMEDLKETGSYELGYLAKSIPYSIPQIVIEPNTQFLLQMTREDSEIETQNKVDHFIDNLKKYDNYYTPIYENKLPDDKFIVGYHKKRWYVASNKILSKDLVEEQIEIFLAHYSNQKDDSEFKYKDVKVSIYLNYTMNLNDYYRVCAKIIFNYLAFAKGKEFVMNKAFDPIRKWMAHGGENSFAEIINSENRQLIPAIPDEAHYIVVQRAKRKNEDVLFGLLHLYGSKHQVIVELCNNYDKNFPAGSSEPFEMIGFICDWQNKREITLIEHLTQIYDDDQALDEINKNLHSKF